MKGSVNNILGHCLKDSRWKTQQHSTSGPSCLKGGRCYPLYKFIIMTGTLGFTVLLCSIEFFLVILMLMCSIGVSSSPVVCYFYPFGWYNHKCPVAETLGGDNLNQLYCFEPKRIALNNECIKQWRLKRKAKRRTKPCAFSPGLIVTDKTADRKQ